MAILYLRLAGSLCCGGCACLRETALRLGIPRIAPFARSREYPIDKWMLFSQLTIMQLGVLDSDNELSRWSESNRYIVGFFGSCTLKDEPKATIKDMQEAPVPFRKGLMEDLDCFYIELGRCVDETVPSRGCTREAIERRAAVREAALVGIQMMKEGLTSNEIMARYQIKSFS
jgi:hypothetical protein